LIARKEKELEEHSTLLRNPYNKETKYISADWATAEGIEKIKQVKEEIGPLVIAAGIEVNGAFESTPREKKLQVIHVNIVATLQLTHHFIKAMIDRKKRRNSFDRKLISSYAQPMKAMDPSIVAEFGLNGLGKRMLSVPGGMNKMMAWMAKYLPLEMLAKMNEKMIRKAIKTNKLQK
jgi:uncharacterized protein